MPPLTFQFIAALLLAFTYGVLVGVLAPAIFRAFRPHPIVTFHHEPGEDPAMTTRRAQRERKILLVLTAVALLLSALAGFLYVLNASADSERVACAARYNQLAGESRDERDTYAQRDTRAELRVWRDLRDTLARPTSSRGDVLAAVDQRVEALERLQRARAENPYPDPDYCAGK